MEEFREKFCRPAKFNPCFTTGPSDREVYAASTPLNCSKTRRSPIPTCGPSRNQSGAGSGLLEAPRGTLIHDYTNRCPSDGDLSHLIVGTTHNLGPSA